MFIGIKKTERSIIGNSLKIALKIEKLNVFLSMGEKTLNDYHKRTGLVLS